LTVFAFLWLPKLACYDYAVPRRSTIHLVAILCATAPQAQEQPIRMLNYYGASMFPHVISADFSYITRFYACFEVGDKVIVATKLWPINRHGVFTASRNVLLSGHYDDHYVWVTFAAGEKARLTINHDKIVSFYGDPRCQKPS
jgi:hypothetical protein